MILRRLKHLLIKKSFVKIPALRKEIGVERGYLGNKFISWVTLDKFVKPLSGSYFI